MVIDIRPTRRHERKGLSSDIWEKAADLAKDSWMVAGSPGGTGRSPVVCPRLGDRHDGDASGVSGAAPQIRASVLRGQRTEAVIREAHVNGMPRARAFGLGSLVPILVLAAAASQAVPTIFEAVLGEAGQSTAEVSTAELRHILADKSAVVLDARPVREYGMSHIPGAVNVAPKPGVPMSMYVSDLAEIDRLVRQRKRSEERRVGKECRSRWSPYH